jgi:CHAD domain-containing protein
VDYLEAERERQEEITNLKAEIEKLKRMLKKVLENQKEKRIKIALNDWIKMEVLTYIPHPNP